MSRECQIQGTEHGTAEARNRWRQAIGSRLATDVVSAIKVVRTAKMKSTVKNTWKELSPNTDMKLNDRRLSWRIFGRVCEAAGS